MSTAISDMKELTLNVMALILGANAHIRKTF